jgi:cyclophilin family peptidyl-prolyl cis-trans isomerase
VRIAVLTALALISCPLRAGLLVTFRTTLGDMEVELHDQHKPVTVQNFLRYAQGGFYRDSIFHRCPPDWLSGQTHFVVQGGGIFVYNRYTQPGLYFIPTFSPITNEFHAGRFYSNAYGTIAMAKTSDPNSATSQFFFNLDNNSASLDDTNNSGGFTVFGQVIRGTNILNQFIGRSYNNGIVDLSGVHAMLAELPVNFYGTKNVTYNDLIYVDVEALAVSITRTNDGCALTWKSVAGKINYVEYATNTPPLWQALTARNGTGLSISVADTNKPIPVRFYRVRVDY